MPQPETSILWVEGKDDLHAIGHLLSRGGDHVTREPQEVINERKQVYRRVGYEQRFRADATLDDLDLELAREFLARTPFGARPVTEALSYYGLIEQAAQEWRVTNAALLLFARAPALRWHPRAGLRLFRIAGTSRQHGRRRNVTRTGRADPPLASAIAEAHRLAGQQVRRSEKLNGLYFEEVPEYPDFAWQEAIVNAFAHRDYEYQGREVEAWFYEDGMEVSSPGDLLPPVTLARLRERLPAHATRNPLIVRVLADAGVMREGEGVARIFEEMAASSLREPEVEMEDGVFSVRLYNEPVGWAAGCNPRDRPIRHLASCPPARALPPAPEPDQRRLPQDLRGQPLYRRPRAAATRRERSPAYGGKGQGRPLSPRGVLRRARKSCEMSPETCAQLPLACSLFRCEQDQCTRTRTN